MTMSDEQWGEDVHELAPFDQDKMSADPSRDFFQACRVIVMVDQVGDFGNVYAVSVENQNGAHPSGSPGHAIEPRLVECSDEVESGRYNRLVYIRGANPRDVEKVRHAARSIIAQVAEDHARGYCVWGPCDRPERFYGEWLNRPADWMDTHVAECTRCNGLGWQVWKYVRPSTPSADPMDGVTKEECFFCNGVGMVLYEREEVDSTTYAARAMLESEKPFFPRYFPRDEVEVCPEGEDLRHLADALNSDLKAFRSAP